MHAARVLARMHIPDRPTMTQARSPGPVPGPEPGAGLEPGAGAALASTQGRAWRPQARAGYSLAEVLVAFAIATMLLVVVWGIFSHGLKLSQTTSHFTELTSGARKVLEHLVRDVDASHMLFDPQTVALDSAHNLVCIKYASDGVDDRLAKNTSLAYPFAETSSSSGFTPTFQKMNAIRVIFAYDVGKRTVRRKEETGELTSWSVQADPNTLAMFKFAPTATVDDKQLATSVEAFDITPVAYDTTGEPKLISALGLPIEKTACVLVHLVAQFDEGLYSGAPNAPRVEMSTKVWVYRRMEDEMYREYFSSADEDLRY